MPTRVKWERIRDMDRLATTGLLICAGLLLSACAGPARTAPSPAPAPASPPTAGPALPALLPGGPGAPVGKPRFATDARSLFAAINGGAEVYLERGFVRGAFQTYEPAPGRKVNLEVYEMKDAAAARAVHARRSSAEGEPAAVGDAATAHGYYLLMVQGRFFVAVTGHDVEQTALDELLPLARSAAARLARAGGP